MHVLVDFGWLVRVVEPLAKITVGLSPILHAIAKLVVVSPPEVRRVLGVVLAQLVQEFD